MVTDYLFSATRSALLKGLSTAQIQPCSSEALPSFLHRLSLHCLPALHCWCPAEGSGQKPSMATYYTHGNSARRWRQKEQRAHSCLGYHHKARNTFPLPRANPYVRSNQDVNAVLDTFSMLLHLTENLGKFEMFRRLCSFCPSSCCCFQSFSEVRLLGL